MKKILIIENQQSVCHSMLTSLNKKGFRTIIADNGQIGVQQAQVHLPDVILCSILLPELDGYGVLAALRQNPATAIIPFIFCTTKAHRADLRRAMELGASDYLTKPCTPEEVVKAVAAQLEKQTLLQRWYRTESAPTIAPDPPLPGTKSSIFPAVPRLHKLFEFIEAHYHESITLEDVARAVGYSPAYLTSLARLHTGQTVQQWIVERRMVAARALLLETDLQIVQIAAKIGYHHAVHFFRQFRKLHGTSPRAWRSIHRANLEPFRAQDNEAQGPMRTVPMTTETHSFN